MCVCLSERVPVHVRVLYYPCISVKLKFCIALSRLQGCVGCCVCPVSMFDGMIAMVQYA